LVRRRVARVVVPGVAVSTWALAAMVKRSRNLSVQVRMLPATAKVRNVHGRAWQRVRTHKGVSGECCCTLLLHADGCGAP
jgi:hypothetical protein